MATLSIYGEAEYSKRTQEAQGPMSLHTFLGYFTGLYFISSDLDATTLWRTAVLVHILDAILCGLIAGSSRRSRSLWTAAGLCFGIWALAAIFLLPSKRRVLNHAEESQSSCAIT
jgi:hypothetical protein